VRTSAHRLAAILAVTLVSGTACSSPAGGEPPKPASEPAKADWSRFEGTHDPIDARNARAVPERPIEITGVPYIRGVRLAWSRAAEVPAYEPENETLKLPAGARQAVLAVAVADLPADARLHVEWYFGDERVFGDALASHDDGDHYFALVKREGRDLVGLPAGRYRAELLDGSVLIKTVRFEVLAQ
jgi:hypothetical protein